MTESRSGKDVLLLPQMSQSIFDLLWKNGYRPSQTVIESYAISGLVTDGAHHKQWYLERILEALNVDLGELRKQLEGKDHDWEPGVAP